METSEPDDPPSGDPKPERRPRPRSRRKPIGLWDDLNAVNEKYRIEGTIKLQETTTERSARLASEKAVYEHDLSEQAAASRQARIHGTIVLTMVASLVSISFLACLAIVLVPGFTPDTVR